MALFTLSYPPDPAPSLIVQTCERADERTIKDFMRLLYGQRCAHGLLFDQEHCRIIRDTFTSLDTSSFEVEQVLSTTDVLSKLDRPGGPKPQRLDRRIEVWLEVLVLRWEDAIPDEPEIARYFYQDIVPASAQAIVTREGDPAEDAA